MNLAFVQTIGIKYITELTIHRIMREGDLIVHNIERANGGTSRLHYTSDGRISKFEISNLLVTIDNDDDILISIPE